MDHTGGGFAASSWAAMLGHHGIGPSADHHASFSAVAHAHSAAVAHHAHHGMPMDLHVPQAFPYYRFVPFPQLTIFFQFSFYFVVAELFLEKGNFQSAGGERN